MSEAQVYTHTIQSGSNRENCEAPGRSILLTDNLWRGAGIALVVVLWQLGVLGGGSGAGGGGNATGTRVWRTAAMSGL